MRKKLLLILSLLVLVLTPSAAAEWTVMVYMDGDNDLNDFAIDDLNEMELIGSTDQVNVIVLADFLGNGNSRIYSITQDGGPLVNSTIVLDLSEVNMGDPETLAWFVNWTVNNYPAKHYALILWNHGTGWKLKCIPPIKGICWDDTSNSDYLTSSELQYALSKIKSLIGRDLDIIGFDACLMGMEEIDYLINASMPSAIRVGSEEVEPGDGWPYDLILANLTANPSMTPEELATEIVNDYYRYYSSRAGVSDFTLSAVYVNNSIDEAINYFVQTIMGDQSNLAIVAGARYSVEEFLYTDYIDLYSFTQIIWSSSASQTVKDAAAYLMDAINTSIIAERHGSGHPNVKGISIYFPATRLEYNPDYEYLKFANDTQWDEFLTWFYSMPEPIIIIEGEPHIAKGDVAWFRGGVYGADSASWSLLGPYNMSSGDYLNQPLVPLHHFTISINTTDLFMNYNATVGNYVLKIEAKNEALSYIFAIDDIYVTVNVTPTLATWRQEVNISGTTNVADSGSICDDVRLVGDPAWENKVTVEIVNPSGCVIWSSVTSIINGSFKSVATVDPSWTPGTYKVVIRVDINPFINESNYTSMEIMASPVISSFNVNPSSVD